MVLVLACAFASLCLPFQAVVGGAEKLNHELATQTHGWVDAFAFNADATRIVCSGRLPGTFGIDRGIALARVDAPAFDYTRWSGPVLRFALTADDAWVVYQALQPLTGYRPLLAVSTDGERRHELHHSVSSFQVAPDGTVVFVPDDDGAGRHLWAVAPDGSGLRQLSASTTEPYSVRSFALAPGGARVFYRSDEQPGSAVCLHAVPLDGSVPPVQVSGTPAGGLPEFAVSPDGWRALYRAEQTTVGTFELFLSGPPALPVSGPLVAGGDVTAFAFTPDGSGAVYIADQDQDERFELYAVPLLGGPGVPRKVSGALVAGGDVLDFRVAPDSRRVLLRGDLRSDGVEELFVAPLDGSAAPLPLSWLPIAGADVRPGYGFDDTGTRALYLADANVDEHDALFSVPLDRSRAPVRLNGPLVLGGDVAADFACHAGTVVYRAEEELDDVAELHAVPVDGGPATRLSSPLVETRTVSGFALVAGGAAVAYRADHAENQRFEVFLVPLDGSAAPRRAHPTIRADSVGVRDAIPIDGGRVLYLADAGVYAVDADRGKPPIRLNDPHGRVEDLSWAVSPDGNEVVFRQAAVSNGPFVLYGAPVDGSRPARPLSDRSIPQGNLPQFTPDSRRVVFRASSDLLVAPIDASTPALQLDGAEGFDAFGISPDGARVFYRNDFGGFSAPLDGSAPATPLPDVDARPTFAFSADGTRLIYVDHVRADRLFTAPLAGGAALQLSTTAVWPAPVLPAFGLSPDRAWAAYGSGSYLYSVPTDGHLPPLRLGTGSAGRLAFPDSQRVIFRSSGLLGATGMSIAPLDGSASPRLLSTVGVLDFATTADGTRVVFRDTNDVLKVVNVDGTPAVRVLARLECREFLVGGSRVLFTVEVGERHDLYVVDLAGRVAPQRISTHERGEGVERFWFAGDGQHALYLAEEHRGGPELFAVRLPKAVQRR